MYNRLISLFEIKLVSRNRAEQKSTSSAAILDGLVTSPIVSNDPLRLDAKEVQRSSRIIGRGAYGVVYFGYYQKQPVAIKEFADYKWLLEELKPFCRINSPHTLRLVGYTTQPPCLLTQFMDNNSVNNYLAKTKLTGQELLVLASGVVCGLHYLHGINFVHRDIKAANVLLDNDFKPVMADFGSVTLVGTEITRYHATPLFMAPEILHKTAKKVSKKEDIYSLGILLFELLVGKEFDRIFRCRSVEDVCRIEDTGERLKIINRTITEKIKNQQCPGVIADLIFSCLKSYPEQRPTIEDIVEHLEHCHYSIETQLRETVKEFFITNKKLQLQPNAFLMLYSIVPDVIKKEIVLRLMPTMEKQLVSQMLLFTGDIETRQLLMKKFDSNPPESSVNHWMQASFKQLPTCLAVITQASLSASQYLKNPSSALLVCAVDYYRKYKAHKVHEITCLNPDSVELIDEYTAGPMINFSFK